MQVMTIFMSLSMYCLKPFVVILFVYKVLTSYELVCASYDHIYVSIDVLPEAVCCYFVCVQSFNFIRASMCKL